MVKRNFVEICHGCAKEVITVNAHYKAMLADLRVYFHPLCYHYYVGQRGDVLRNVLKFQPKENI